MAENTQNTENQYEEDEFDEQESSGRGGLIFALVFFIILFLASAGLHVYQQYAIGDGSFAWSLGATGDNQQNKEQVAALEAENEALKSENENLEAKIAELQDNQHATPRERQDWMRGEVYEVQIGAFKFFDMSWYEDNMVQIQMERDQNFNHFTIGRFRDIDRARYFLEDIQRLGIEEARLIKRVDGQKQGFVE